MTRTITPPRGVVKYFETQSKYASTVRVYISVDMEGIAGVVHELRPTPATRPAPPSTRGSAVS